MRKSDPSSKRDAGASSQRRRASLPRSLKAVNLDAAGIDIGSTFHFVAVPEGRADPAVRQFGCLTPDLHEMGKWLKHCGIVSVALESTGVYWIPVLQILEQYGIEAKLVDAYHVKNVPGRKSDVQDCQWLQRLHMYGLLRAAFVPEQPIAVLRSYWRHRVGLVEAAARQIQLMQKSLEMMNLQLHKVLSDISGLSGMKIIRAILVGERDPAVLARMKHRMVKSSEETIAKALTGDWREEHLFTLRQALELYDVYQDKIVQCDWQIEQYMTRFAIKADPADLAAKPTKKNKRGKNEPRFDLRSHLYQISGVDLTLIDGIDVMTAQTLISECGFDMSRFPSERHFSSWMGLCPNNKITGGKVFGRRSRKVHNRVATALRVAAQSLHRSSTALGAFYRRMRARLGAPKAITATAHKLATLVYRMLKFGENYVDKGQEYYERQYQERVVRSLQRRAKEMGFTLAPLATTTEVS